jgi:RNA polymerase sigma-70 factor (ECF subfamily)
MNGPNCTSLLNVRTAKRVTASNDEIVSAAQEGSPRAFAELYAIYSPRLYRTIVGITKNPQDAEDALQETFMRACLAIRAFEGRASFSSWLTRIAINSALLILRKRRARAEIFFDPLPANDGGGLCPEFRDPAPNPEQLYELSQLQTSLKRAMRKLGPGLYGPIRMRMVKESSVKEIGRALSLSDGAVKARLFRARLRLSVSRER